MAEQKKTTKKSATTKGSPPKKTTAVRANAPKNTKATTPKKTTAKKETTKVSAKPTRFGDSILDEIILLIIIVISIVALISLVTEKMGFIGQLFNNLCKGLFGFGGILLPFLVIAYCIWLLMSQERKWPVVRGFGALLFLISCGAGAWLINPVPTTEAMGIFEKMGRYYTEGSLANGGFFGGVVGSALYSALDTLGSTIVLVSLVIISLIMSTGKSLFQAIGDYSDHHQERQKIKNEKIKSRAAQIRQTELAEEAREVKRYARNVKKGSYNIEVEETGKKKAVAPQVEETVFRKKPPTAFPKATPIYDFTLEETLQEVPLTTGGGKPFVSEEKTVSVSAASPSRDREVVAESVLDDIFAQAPAPEIEVDLAKLFPPEEMSLAEEDLFAIDAFEEISIVTADQPEISVVTAEQPEISVIAEDQPKLSSQAETVAVAPVVETDKEKITEEIPETLQEEVEQPYLFPPIELLGADPKTGGGDSKAEMLANARKLESTLKSFGVEAKVVQINRGPTVTRYELSPSQGVKVSKIVNLADDIALNLAASGIRIEAPIPGKAAVGIEVPNKETQSVYLRTVLDSENFRNHSSKLAFALGEDIAGNTVVTDIAKMPHLLIAGATGSGKSVCINTLITSILYKADPKEVKLLLVDPKVVELSVYNGIPHLLIPVVTDPKKASAALNWAVREMLQRYNDFAACGVRDIKGFNAIKDEAGDEKGKMPQIVIVIDELADLMMAAPGEVEDSICRLAQMARAAGMHLIIATQRPSVDVITGVIKANIPSRLAFAVSSGIDSRTILDMVGAEKLLGKGDMLFYPAGQSKPTRLQGAFVTDKEVEEIVNFLRKSGRPGYSQETIEKITSVAKGGVGSDEESDEYFDQAMDLIIEKEKASVSMLQRQFRIGYNRAARLMDELEKKGMVSPEDGSKPRKVLITRAQWEAANNPVEEEIP